MDHTFNPALETLSPSRTVYEVINYQYFVSVKLYICNYQQKCITTLSVLI